MRSSFALLTAFALVAPALAQAPAANSSGDYSPEQLDQMVAPIALYPDPLVALILPAATAPSDITLAANFLANNGDPSAIDSQSWDPSIKGLAHYPAVLQWMNENLPWAQALGTAFLLQPADVMKSIQQLRAQALAAGTLVNTPQQEVDVEGDEIRIVPAQQDMIYAPQYDPDLVFDDVAGYTGPFVTFGVGYPVGPWLGYECDWDDFGIWIGPWQPGWEYRRDWRGHTVGSVWRPNAARARMMVRNFYRPDEAPPRPRSIAGAPAIGRRPSAPAPARAAPRPATPAPAARPDYRGWTGEAIPGGVRPGAPAPRGSVYGGYNRGTETQTYSDRGQASRQAPVRSMAPAPRPEPAPRSAPAPSGGGNREQR